MKIYDALQKISKSEHYLRRYVKYITLCETKNITLPIGTYTERHHILPKEIFEEYSSFSKHPWNMVVLTYRQHLIAHWMLWKIIGTTGQLSAFFLMGHRNYGFPSFKKSSLLEKARLERASIVAGHCAYKDSSGNSVWLKTTDSRVISGEVTHHQKGMGYYLSKSDGVLWLPITDNRVTSGEVTSVSRLPKSTKGIENIRNAAIKDGIPARRIIDMMPIGKVPLTDIRWETGEIVHASTGHMVATNGTITKQFSIDDPLVISGEFKSITKGKVSVVDSKGVHHQISVDDPRYVSGEFVHNMTGHGIYRNKEGIRRVLPVDDPLVISGEFYSVMLGKSIYKNKEGQSIALMVDDPRVISGEYVSVMKGKTVYKDKEGNLIQLAKDDPRVVSGEVVGHTIGMGVYIDHNGNLIRCETSDLRVKSGELIGSRALKKKFYDADGTEHICHMNHPNVRSGEWKPKPKRPYNKK